MRTPNYRLSAKESRIYDRQRQFERGVNTARMPYPLNKASFGESHLGYQIKGMQCPHPTCGAEGHWTTAIMIHVETLIELEAMPAPKLKGI